MTDDALAVLQGMYAAEQQVWPFYWDTADIAAAFRATAAV